MLYALLAALIAILYGFVYMKESFVLKYGNPFNDEDLVSTDPNAKGTRIFGITPDTCPCEKPELDAGLCYERCESGYHGVGPVCWADTVSIGIGKVLLLESCDKSGYGGWEDWGLICHEKLRWNSCKWKLWGLCVGGLSGGRLGAKRLSCDGYDGRYPDKIASLCYRKCHTFRACRISVSREPAGCRMAEELGMFRRSLPSNRARQVKNQCCGNPRRTIRHRAWYIHRWH